MLALVRSKSPGASNHLVHRNEPLRRIAEYHWLLRAPRMRVLMLKTLPSHQFPSFDQRLNDCFIGVALFALIRNHTPAFKTRRILCQVPLGIHSERDSSLE